MPKQATVVLGGREYTLQEKHAGPHQVWRDRLEDSDVMKIFKSLDGAMAQLVAAGDAIQEALAKAREPQTEDDGEESGGPPLNRFVDVLRILPIIVIGVTGSMREVHNLVFDYDGKLATDRKWILANAYDSEIVEAFMEIVKLAYPTMALWDMVTGRRAHLTASNLPSTNGVSGLPASGPKKPMPTS